MSVTLSTDNSSLTAVECGGGEGRRLVTCDVLLSKYGNVRIFLKLPYPTKRACAVIHIRPKVSPTKMNRINRPRNSQNTKHNWRCKQQENPNERESASLAKPTDGV